MRLETDEKVICYIKRRIKEARKVVAVLGVEMLVEGGGRDLDSNDENYRVEEEYGFSPEDILSGSFFNAKIEKFYQFYKKEILGMQVGATPAYDALLKLQSQGKLLAVISQNFYGIPQGVHFDNVIELNGNLYKNRCPRCNKHFAKQYLLDAEGIPMCDQCKTAVRPDIRLVGERIDAKLLTSAATVCEDADVILILGRNMYHDRLEYNLPLEKEQLKVLFSREGLAQEKRADLVIRDEIRTILPLLVG